MIKNVIKGRDFPQKVPKLKELVMRLTTVSQASVHVFIPIAVTAGCSVDNQQTIAQH